MFGDLLGTIMGGASKPTVPDAPKLSDSQQTAIQANIDALPGAESLASKTNIFNQDQILKMLKFAIPNYDALTSRAGSNIESLLRGEIPQDISQRVQTNDAVRALQGGYAGTGMHGNLTARDLGLTSLDLTQRGLSSAESWIGMMDQLFAPGTMNVASMFISPMQQYAADENAWGVKWLKNQIKAMPDPMMEALGQFIGGIGDAAASYFVGSAATQRSPSSGSSGSGGFNFSSLMGGGGASSAASGAASSGAMSAASGAAAGFGGI